MTDLDELYSRVSELKRKVALGETSLIDEELQSYFHQLSSLISPDKLERGLTILQDSTIVLEQKFEAIQLYIQELLNSDRVIGYLNSHPPDAELAGMLENVMVDPVLFPQLSLAFLDDAYSKLVSHKPLISRARLIQSDILVTEKNVEFLSDPEDPFERRMMDYYSEISAHLPATIDKLLQVSSTKDDYFEHFSFILHLLQNGILWYEKPTREVKLDNKRARSERSDSNE